MALTLDSRRGEFFGQIRDLRGILENHLAVNPDQPAGPLHGDALDHHVHAVDALGRVDLRHPGKIQ